ncbi:MAG: response regulator [Fulvivirga sp.]
MSRALVVDDEKEICLLLSSMMKKLGFASDHGHSLSEGKSKLTTNEYDIVFLDLNLPDGIGFHLIDTVKGSNPKAKVIIISAYDGNVERQRAISQGADYFIPKPFSKKAVVDALDNLNVSYTV